MKCAGTKLPALSLSRPVSISWLMSTFTLTIPSFATARMRIGSAMSASTSAEGHLDFLLHHVELPVGLHQCKNVRGLAHLDARGDRRFRSRGNVEGRRKRVRVL